ncbi:primase-like DNA-binding domain-containing protein [Cryobacterium fucosi]|nr:primase-like DNA-binding domain-containing protein [Cryobacterium fucosi]
MNRGLAIGELRCVSPQRPASLDELVALRTARDCIDELIRSCVDELRTDPQSNHTWQAVADALRASSAAAARQQYGSSLAPADEHVLAFWHEFEDSFAWDFLPVDFLHPLYTQWMSEEFRADTPFPKKAFTRRLKAAATPSGDWVYVRSRVGSMMDAAEPLASRVPGWSGAAAGNAGAGTEGSAGSPQYGLRRSATMRAPGPTRDLS